jgi:hypothetical protein
MNIVKSSTHIGRSDQVVWPILKINKFVNFFYMALLLLGQEFLYLESAFSVFLVFCEN